MKSLGLKAAGLAVLAIAAAAVLYVAIALLLTIFTPGRVPRATGAEAISVYVCDNGVHADIVVPVAAVGMDWAAIFLASRPDLANAGLDHVGFGWGSREFYVHTPRWRDVRPLTALRAAFWDRTALHVEFRPRPQRRDDCRIWPVPSDGYRALVGFVTESLETVNGRPVPLAVGYGPHDRFFAADGRYTLLRTCNQWSGEALRAAGAPVSPWTPFSFLVGWNLPAVDR